MVSLDLFVLVAAGIYRRSSSFKTKVLVELAKAHFEGEARVASFEKEVRKEKVQRWCPKAVY